MPRDTSFLVAKISILIILRNNKTKKKKNEIGKNRDFWGARAYVGERGQWRTMDDARSRGKGGPPVARM